MSMIDHLFNNKEIFNMDCPLPDTILIESFMGCNLRCGMCPVPSSSTAMKDRKFQAMTFDVFQTIIDQISDHPRRVHLNQMGEPLLNPQIVSFVQYAKDKNHIVSLTTNGTVLTDLLSEQLVKAGIDSITISFDGATKKRMRKSVRVRTLT